MELEDFRKALRVDKQCLDEELEKQPSLYDAVSQEYALAVSRRDQLKERLKRVDARLYRQLREKYASEGAKFTDSLLNAEVITHAKHKEAYSELVGAAQEAQEWEALKEAFTQRAYVLKDLCGLFVAGYFQVTSVRGDSSTAVQQRAYESSREGLSRRRLQE